MGYMVEITENVIDELAENTEKMLRYAGKVMQCVDSLSEERGGGRTGRRMPAGGDWRGMSGRDTDMDNDGYGWRDDNPYGERRGRGGYRRY